MKKLYWGFLFLMLIMISEVSFAQIICVPSGTHTVACYPVGGSIPSGLTQPPAVNTSYSPTFSTEAHKQKQCADEKGKIENENGRCMSETAKDFAREVGNCNSLSNGEWSISGGGEYRFLFGSITYTIQNPNYEKCINTVSSYQNMGEKLCAERKTNQEAVARSWNNAQCAEFYK